MYTSSTERFVKTRFSRCMLLSTMPRSVQIETVYGKRIYSKPLNLSPNLENLLQTQEFTPNRKTFFPKHNTLLKTKGIYFKLREFTPNQRTFFQTIRIYSKPREFTPNPGALLQTKGIYSKPREFTPKP